MLLKAAGEKPVTDPKTALGDTRELQNSERGSMSDFLSEIQSDELARCEEYQEWLELRRLEAIESMEQEAEND